jgi:hypothetical protein
MSVNEENDEPNRRLAGEVVELGEALFDTLFEAASGSTASADDLFAATEVSEAIRKFFTALRLLLKLDEP